MTNNKLKVNDDNTELLIITSKHNQDKIINHQMQIGTATVTSSANARNLGIVFDNTMSMESHVKKICQSAFYHIRNINSIRKILSKKSASILIHAFITSRLDNGNSLLYGINKNLIKKLLLVYYLKHVNMITSHQS